MKLKLTNPTDDQIDAAVAEHVAGWTHLPLNEKPWISPGGTAWDVCKPFTRSADAVLPLLEKTFCVFSYHADRPGDRFQFCADKTRNGPLFTGHGPFPRAACIALLRAHGVEVEFTQ